MKPILQLTATIGLLVATSGTAFAQQMSVSSATVSGSVSDGITVAATPLHALGPNAVSLVAFELSGNNGAMSLPPANDSGQSGDAVAGDGTWSLTVKVPGSTPGNYAMKVYMVDTNGAEFVSDPINVTLN